MKLLVYIKQISRNEKLLELIRFGIVGVVATVLHYVIYWFLKQWLNYNIAYTIGYAVSFIGNFFLSANFTFKSKATVNKGLGFGGAHLFNYLFQMVLLNGFVYLGVNKTVSPILVYIIVIPTQFILVRFVFKRN